MIAIQEKAGKKRIKTKSKKSERGQLRGGWWQKNGNNHRYSGPQDRRTFADPENFFVKKINTCETHNLGLLLHLSLVTTRLFRTAATAVWKRGW